MLPDADAAATALPGERDVLLAAQQALRGERRGIVSLIPFLGPAFVAAVAYVDPGNFATNVSAGAQYGYELLWVVLLANLVAMLVQSLSAKLGIATGHNLAELCRAQFPRPIVLALWAQAELVAMATDLAEFVGAALGMNLLFGLPLLPAGLLTAVIAFAILGVQTRGFRAFEVVVAALVGVIVVVFSSEVVLAAPSSAGVLRGLVTPRFSDTQSVLLAAGILGATVMPHVIYLHSALTQHRIVGRDERERHTIMGFERLDVVIAMTIAGLCNMAMLITAAAVFHDKGSTTVSDLHDAYGGLGDRLGAPAAVLFGVALLASGLSSSSVGTMAGQVVMQGFIRRRIPLRLRRLITMLPALIVIALGVDPSLALVLSQVVLSFGIPFALVPLVMFCNDVKVMGGLANHRLTTVVASVVVALIVGLNGFLIFRLVASPS